MSNKNDGYSLHELPEEIIRTIFHFLPDDDVFVNLRMVNRKLKRIVDDYLVGTWLLIVDL